ncbi:BTB/POZ domain-containing protein 2-like isoform X3 [Sinocyclocheilus anshuiensis]|uniref:BTB/POZ domain-containing protein 2-like n=1 Tax=Sinocyclocheilus anshuiensis TaxID=1608454 RepID=A0A671KKE8_9TELE|nr:PREDICTED: BTB/POZ domain-containing protein 2-like isoform X3 [Sinocyclocheilus anshuiensis]
MRCCVCLFQQSLQCSPSKMAAGESNSRSSCLNLSNSGPLGNAPPSNSAHSSPASNGGAVAAAGGMNRSAGNANPRSGPENGGGAESAVRSTPSAHNPRRQAVGPSGATSSAASNMTATPSSSSSSLSASTASSSADASAAVASLPSSPASVLIYREPVYNWQATKSTVKERFLYSDEVQIGPETVMTTLYTAKKYAVPALEAHCVEFLKKNLRADNAFMLLTQARLFDEPQLASLCLENIDKNTADALAAEGFTDVDIDTLVAVLERDTLGVREVRLFGAAVRWAEAEAQRQQLQPTPENKRRVLGKALSLIRFPLMTIEEFAAGPAQSGILTDREVVSLFLHFTVNPKPHVEFIDRPRCCLRGKECSITRFSQVESRWGYSGTSDRIRFSVNRRIFVVGFGLYGSIHGPTDYQVNIQIIHTDSNTVLGQNDTGFSCDGTASTFRVMFKEPVEILPSVNYIACATLKGPDSHYGTKGMRKVTHEAPATGTKTCFTFCYAAGNNNGTSVEDGQIPEVIFYT